MQVIICKPNVWGVKVKIHFKSYLMGVWWSLFAGSYPGFMHVFCDRLVTVLASHRKHFWFVVYFSLCPFRLQVTGQWKVEVGIWIQGRAASWMTTPVRSSMPWPRPSCLTLSSCSRDWLYWRCWLTTGIQGNALVPMHYNKIFPFLCLVLFAWLS